VTKGSSKGPSPAKHPSNWFSLEVRIAAEGWTPPETARSAFVILASHGALPPELAARLGRAVGRRNILVHDDNFLVHDDVDVERLAAIVRDDLGDLRTFASVVAAWAR
jgi:uncharacterized protein YutE (UPF0331/DUF86 family)